MDGKRAITARVIRPGEIAIVDDGWLARSPEERIEAVWTLTAICLAWTGGDSVNHDFKDLLAAFNDRGVEYLIVGAHALAAHGHVRATKDLDVWVRPERDNADRVWQALSSFGAPLRDLTADDLCRPGLVFQIGVEPLRIDVVTAIDGVDFGEAWPERMEARFGGEPAHVLSRHHLIVNKRAAGRLQDLADIQRLEQLASPEENP